MAPRGRARSVSRGTHANPKAGKSTFVTACGVCHTLKAAGTQGTIGPDLSALTLSQAQIIIAMQLVFDRPTPYTLNSTFVSPATKTKLKAEVKLKDESAKGLPATKYLAPDGG